MGKVTKVVKPSKINEVIFNSYQDAITNRMKAGHDVTRLTSRLKLLLSKYKTN